MANEHFLPCTTGWFANPPPCHLPPARAASGRHATAHRFPRAASDDLGEWRDTFWTRPSAMRDAQTQSFGSSLSVARAARQSLEGQVDAASAALTLVRVTVLRQLFANFGGLLQHYLTV